MFNDYFILEYQEEKLSESDRLIFLILMKLYLKFSLKIDAQLLEQALVFSKSNLKHRRSN